MLPSHHFLFTRYLLCKTGVLAEKRSPHSQPVRFPQAIAKNKKSEAAENAGVKSDNFMT